MAIDRVLLYVKIVVFMIVISALGLLVKALVANGYWWIAITFPFLAYLMCRAVGCDQPSSAEAPLAANGEHIDTDALTAAHKSLPTTLEQAKRMPT